MESTGAETVKEETAGTSDGSIPMTDVVAGAVAFLKTLAFLIPVYLAGYFGLSLAWVLLGLGLYLGWRSTRQSKERSLESASYVLHDERAAVTANTVFLTKRDLPAWISFPDVEKVEWLNKILKQAWPFIGQYLEKLLVENIAPSIRQSNNHLQTFAFTKVKLGEKPLKVIGVKAHTELDKRQILLDLHLSYVGDIEIDVEVRRYFCKAGVKGVQLHGMLRVILEPLIGNVPIVGAVTLFFIRRPKLTINWTGLTNLLDIPGLNSMSDTMILETISSFLVLPNRLTVPLVQDLHVAQLRSPLPRGVVRVHLIEAQNLMSTDTILQGKSDPYVILRVGTRMHTSRVIDDTLNPKWNEMFEFVVHEVPGQELEVEVFDKDPDKDDFLGRTKLDLGDVMTSRVLDKWFPLNDVEKGKIHLKMEWLSLITDASKLDEVFQVNSKITTQKNEEPSAAILAVYLDRAQELPLKKGGKEPNPMVQISVKDVTRESKTCFNTSAPVWEDAFMFFVHNPKEQDVDIQVKDDDRQLTLGSVTLPLSRLLESKDLALDQWFKLDHSSPGSQIYLKVILRILYLDTAASLPPRPKAVPACPDEPVILPEDGIKAEQIGDSVDPIDKTAEPCKPLHSNADCHFGKEGVVRIHLVEAEDLIAKDRILGIKGKSDPYAVIHLAGKSFRSKTIENNLNPKWFEVYEVIVTEIPGQQVDIDVYDKDVDKDDFLGRTKINLSDIMTKKYIDEWFALADVKSGKLHLRLEWLPPKADPLEIEKVMLINNATPKENKTDLSCAILAVYMARAQQLPLKKGNKAPNPVAELYLSGVTYKTKTCTQTNAPVWEEAFSFLVKDPYVQVLDIQVKDDGKEKLGSLSLPLSHLLQADLLTVDHWFPLANSGTDSEILLRAQLGVLVPHQSSGRTVSTRSGTELSDSDLAATTPTFPDSEVFSHIPSTVENVHSIPVPDSPTSPFHRDLRQRLSTTDSKSELFDSPFSQIRLTIYYNSEIGKLFVVVHACRRLKSKDTCDPYVSLILLPDKNRVTKRKTAVKKKTLNPEYNEKFEFDMLQEEAQKRKLDVSVKHSVPFMSLEKELIGKVQVDLSIIDLSQGVTLWYDLEV